MDDLNSEGSGIDIIRAERARQIEVENWTPDHDDTHTDGSLSAAGASYALHATSLTDVSAGWQSKYRYINYGIWPFGNSWWKPSEDPVRDLAKAGALIAAEIDRILRSRLPDRKDTKKVGIIEQ